MTPKIKALKIHIARLEEILNDPSVKPHSKTAGEILNARFELKQLQAQTALHRPVTK